MNFKNLSILTLLAALSFSFASCSDDDDKKETAENYYFLPTEVKSVTASYASTLEYNAERQIVKYVNSYTDEGELYTTTTITYTGGKPAKIVSQSNEEGEETPRTTLIAYNGNTVTLTKGEEVTTITINDKDCILESIDEYNNITTFEYDAASRISKVNNNGYVSTYTNDDKNGIFKDVNLPQWFLYVLGDEDPFFFNKINNVLVETEYNNAGDKVSSVTTNTFTYNDAGFPKKADIKYEFKSKPDENENESINITYKTIKK